MALSTLITGLVLGQMRIKLVGVLRLKLMQIQVMTIDFILLKIFQEY